MCTLANTLAAPARQKRLVMLTEKLSCLTIIDEWLCDIQWRSKELHTVHAKIFCLITSQPLGQILLIIVHLVATEV